MNGRTIVLAAVLGLALCFGPPPTAGAEGTCPDGWIEAGQTSIINHLETLVKADGTLEDATVITQELQDLALRTEERKAPEAEKTGAPSMSSGSTSLVDSPAFTEALKLAWESGLVSDGDGALTIDLNLFAFKAAGNEWVEMDQALYDTPANRKLRRFGGAISFGGEGERFDRDGDGKADEPLQAEELGDIVTYELRYRIYGSRDRRERENVDRYFGSPAAQAFREAYRGAAGEQGALAKAEGEIWQALEGTDAVAENCVSTEAIDEEFDRHHRGVAETIAASRPALDSLLRTIDNAPILTLAVGGVERKDDFGSDERYAALRYAWSSLEAELLYTEKDAFDPDDPDPTMLKLGAKYSWYVMEKVLGTAKTLLSLEGSYERFEDVPDAKHDTISKVGLKTEYALSDTTTIPISVTWANHEDLLSDEDEVRGHIGLSFDVGSLLGKKKKK